MISAKIITHSINPDGKDLVTLLLKYPRFIHSELMTHRCASKNAASSRAIPYERMCKELKENPAFPEKWGTHQKGMQSGEVADEGTVRASKIGWELARDQVMSYTDAMDGNGIHKSITNRLLEPWCHMTTVFTVDGAGFESIMRLRAHPDAQPEFKVLAYNMLDKYLKSTPDSVNWNDWHIPFAHNEDRCISDRLIISAARCAWTSYGNPEGDRTYEACEAVYKKLVQSDQLHASPFEHQARAENGRHRNFTGWRQNRIFLEEIREANLSKPLPSLKEIMSTKPEWVNIYE